MGDALVQPRTRVRLSLPLGLRRTPPLTSFFTDMSFLAGFALRARRHSGSIMAGLHVMSKNFRLT